jgi:hypothetical protein
VETPDALPQIGVGLDDFDGESHLQGLIGVDNGTVGEVFLHVAQSVGELPGLLWVARAHPSSEPAGGKRFDLSIAFLQKSSSAGSSLWRSG